MRGFRVPPDAPIAGRRLAELKEVGTVDGFRIVAIVRDEDVIVPLGDARIMAGDVVFVVMAEPTLRFFLPMINRRIDEVQKVVVYGAGPTGIRLCAELAETVGNVVVIEPDTARAEAAASELSNTLVVQGDATDAEVLREVNVEAADFFVALSDDDEANLLASLLAQKQGAKRIIVESAEPDYVPVVKSLGMDIVINPRLTMVSAILRYVRRGKVMSVASLADREAEVIELVALEGSKIVGKPLKKVRFPKGSVIGLIKRGDVVLIPDGESVVDAEDHAIVFALPDAVQAVGKLFESKKR